MPSQQTFARPLFGRDDLAATFWSEVKAGRRHFGFEGASGVGKTAFLGVAESTLQGAGYSVARLNAAEQAGEELAIAAIYGELKGLAQDPEAVVQCFRERFLKDTAKNVRKVAAAVAADMVKAVVDKAEKTIEVMQEIAAGEDADDNVADQLEALDHSNRRQFLTKFLQALEDAGNKVAISVDNLDAPDLLGFARYLIAAQAGVVIMAAHNTERDPDNRAWDLIAGDMESYSGRVFVIEPLDRHAVEAWAADVLGRPPDLEFIDEVMASSRGRAFDIKVLLEAERDGTQKPPQRNFDRHLATKRQELDGAARTVGDLLSALPHDVFAPVDRLAVAAASMGVDNLAPSLDALRRVRFLKEHASGIALAHSLLQDFWLADVNAVRREAVLDAWYAAFPIGTPQELTSGATIAMLPLITPKALETKNDDELSAIGTQLVDMGQVEVGLKFLDRPWNFDEQRQEERTLQHALIAAQARLQLGRYEEVEEPLRQAELTAFAPEERIGTLLLRLKLSLRRNAYSVLWKTYAELEPLIAEDASSQAEALSILNVAYRDLLDREGIRGTTEKLQALRGSLTDQGRMAIDRTLARALAKVGDDAAALPYAESGLTLAEEVGSARDLGNAFLARGEVQRYAFRFAEAVSDYQKAAEIARGTGNRDSLLWSLLGEAAAHIEAGEADQTKKLLDQLQKLLTQAGYDHPLESAHLALLRILAGAPSEPIPATVARYETLGVTWVTRLLSDFRKTGRVGRPTPL